MPLLQVRVDQNLKDEASDICAEFGLSLSTAIRMFLKHIVAEGEIPFGLKLDDLSFRAIKATREMRRISMENGNCNMTLEEINEEIAAARKERREREAQKQEKKPTR